MNWTKEPDRAVGAETLVLFDTLACESLRPTVKTSSHLCVANLSTTTVPISLVVVTL